MATKPIHPTKVCTKCGVAKLATIACFRPVATNADGISGECRGCKNMRVRVLRAARAAADPEAAKARTRARNQADYTRNRERRLAAMREKRKLNPELFREYEARKQERHAERIAAYRKKQWAEADKVAAREKLRAWKAANPDKQKAIEVRRAERIKSNPKLRADAADRTARHRDKIGRDEFNRRQREARLADPERSRAYTKKWREANIAQARAADRAYRAKHPEKVIAHAEKRRARLAGAEGEFSWQDVLDLLHLQRRFCYYCSGKMVKFQVDHFIPISRGGSNWPDNIVIACRSCNLSKSAKMPWEWKPDRFSPGDIPHK